MGIARHQVKKLVVLAVFVVLMVAASIFLYKYLVKPSPYYPKDVQTSEDG